MNDFCLVTQEDLKLVIKHLNPVKKARWVEKIKKLGPCPEALIWADGYESLKDAWQKCERGDWMLWLLGKLAGSPESESRKKLVLTACECARLALPYVEKGEARPLKAIETAEQWARGENGITLIDVGNAAATYDAAYAAAQRLSTLKDCADIVRKYYPEAPEL